MLAVLEKDGAALVPKVTGALLPRLIALVLESTENAGVVMGCATVLGENLEAGRLLLLFNLYDMDISTFRFGLRRLRKPYSVSLLFSGGVRGRF